MSAGADSVFGALVLEKGWGTADMGCAGSESDPSDFQ